MDLTSLCRCCGKNPLKEKHANIVFPARDDDNVEIVCQMLVCIDCDNEYINQLKKSSDSNTIILKLKSELADMTAEKERCRNLAVDWALKSDGFEMALQRCENMKLAHEFEELLQTTSIPVAVEKLRELLATKEAAEDLILLNNQVGLDIKDDGADNCARRVYDLLMRKLQTSIVSKEVSK